LLREAVERIAKVGLDLPVRPAPSLALARLLPLAVRIDSDRAPDYLWLALSIRPPLSAVPEQWPMRNQVRERYLDRAELAARVARYDRAAAEVVFAPLTDRLASLADEVSGLGNEGPPILRAAGAFDARIARSLLDSLPEDPPPPDPSPGGMPRYSHQTKAFARLAVAKILALPPELRLRELVALGDEGSSE
jgi:hypothetical protein